MDNSFGKIVAILILVIILFVVPIKYYMEKNQALQEMYISTKTIELVDAARITGFITKDMYEQYYAAINRMNQIYKVELEHIIYTDSEGETTKEKHFITDIESQIYSQGIYIFKIEDYFKIQVIEVSNNTLVSYYGGYIKNEAY